MTTTSHPKQIHAVLGLTKMTDGIVVPILKNSLQGLTANAAIYNKPSVDLAAYGSAISDYEASIPPSLDGGKTALEKKRKLRNVAITMYKQLAHYVEANCNGDMATFVLSGFQARTSTKTSTPPANESIRKVEHGANSGQVDVKLVAVKGAKSYELQRAPVPPGGGPITWSGQAITLVKTATTITGLTPGTLYAFQARALLNTGFTDWSDSVTFMCT